MGDIQIYTSTSGDFNFLLILIISGTYFLYEIGKSNFDNNDDDDMVGGMIMNAEAGAQP